MTANEGTVDRVLRVVLGLVLIALTLMGQIGVWGWAGVVLVATGAIGWCGLYRVLGINTCAVKR
jgi:hypothetical protein